MKNLPIKKSSILPRINGISENLQRLKDIGAKTFFEFKENKDLFELAQLNLQRAIEGVFNISNHLISRIAGGSEATTYAQIANLMGEYNFVPETFALNEFTKIAKYRNRLVHFYAQISQKELYDILQNNLSDIETFLKYIKKVLENPEKWNLKIEE
jgi:uncharacterized protein YutE (UPF0331/DUF86 family)